MKHLQINWPLYVLLIGLAVAVPWAIATESAADTHENYIYLVDMRQAAAVEYYTRKQLYQEMAEDSHSKMEARQDVLDAFKEWERWAEQVQALPPSVHPAFQ